MRQKTSALIFSCLLLVLPLYGGGHLEPVDLALASFLDSLLAPLSPTPTTISGPMPREMEMRRVVDRTHRLLKAEGARISREELLKIGRIVERTSLEFRLSPSLIFSVIHAESHFRSDAVSPAGAIGLMQIQLGTARDYAASVGLPPPSVWSLFQIETNIRLGTGYLRSLIDRFGDLRTALAAYNVGPGAIGRLVSAGGTVGDRYSSKIRVREVYYKTSVTPQVQLVMASRGETLSPSEVKVSSVSSVSSLRPEEAGSM